jgi:iron complex transport system permease protein
VAVVTLAGITLLVLMGRAMDVASFSEPEAVSLGVNMAALRTLLFVIAGVLAAGSVVLAGPIAFVGLICPHFMRGLLGPGHRALVIGSALAGAALILAADIAAVLLDRQLWTGLMPVGVFTAMIGGPVFLWALRPQLGRDES